MVRTVNIICQLLATYEGGWQLITEIQEDNIIVSVRNYYFDRSQVSATGDQSIPSIASIKMGDNYLEINDAYFSQITLDGDVTINAASTVGSIMGLIWS